MDVLMPHFKRMHEMTTWHVHEEIQLLAIDFSTMLFDTMAPMPSWREYYLAHDQTPHYEYMKTVLKAMQWLRGGERWILKSPQHLEQFGPLISTFPDATVLVTHRDPVSVMVSMSTMVCYSARTSLDPVDPVRISGYWADRLETMLNAAMRDRELLPADQSMDILFGDFMADDIGTVRRIYELADQPLTDELAGRHPGLQRHPPARAPRQGDLRARAPRPRPPRPPRGHAPLQRALLRPRRALVARPLDPSGSVRHQERDELSHGCGQGLVRMVRDWSTSRAICSTRASTESNLSSSRRRSTNCTRAGWP